MLRRDLATGLLGMSTRQGCLGSDEVLTDGLANSVQSDHC